MRYAGEKTFRPESLYICMYTLFSAPSFRFFRPLPLILLVFLSVFLTACSDGGEVAETEPEPELETGIASYYADRFNGRLTSTEERYDGEKLTAASKEYPVNTVLEVTNLSNEESVRVRVNDCGPHHPNRIIDLSKAAAREIGIIEDGTGRVSLEVVALGTEGPPCNR